MKVRWQSFINGIDIVIRLRQVHPEGSFKPVAVHQFMLDRYELDGCPDKGAFIRRIKSEMTRELMRYVKAV